MSRKINVLYQNKPCYDIYIEDSFGALADALEPFCINGPEGIVSLPIPMWIRFMEQK